MALLIDPQKGAAAPGAPGADPIKDSDTQNFAVDVLDASMDVPVIVDFWAPWCGPCKQLTPVLERLVREARGRIKLVKVNVDQNQDLAAQLRIQSIPAVYAFVGGRPLDAFVGAQPESAVKAFVGRLMKHAPSPKAPAEDEGQAALEAGDAAGAAAIFGALLKDDPANAKASAGLIRARVMSGDVAGARSVLKDLPPEIAKQADVAAAAAGVELAEESAEPADIAALQAKADADPTDLAVRFELARALYGEGQAEQGIDVLLDIIRRDRTWNDDAARKHLLKIFDALGTSHPLTTAARRRLSSILFS